MGQFGSFKVNVDIGAYQYGPTELGAIPAGTYEPKDADEFAAMSHLAGISFTPEGGESQPYVEMTEAPEPAEPAEPDAAGISAEPALSEPPGGAPAATGSSGPTPASPELLFTFTGDPSTVDTAAWPKADVETADGAELYTWAGEGPAPESAEWVPYTGETKPAA